MSNFEKLKQLLANISQFIDTLLTNSKNSKIVAFVITCGLVAVMLLSDGLQSLFDVGYQSGIVISDIPVTSQIDESVYEVSGVPQMVDVSLVGDLSELQDIMSKKSVKVGLDLTALTEGQHVVKMIATGATENVKVSINPSTATVMIRKKVEKKYSFKYEIINENKEEDLLYGEPKFETDTISIIGSEFLHEKIKYVSALVNVDSQTSDYNADVSFSAYDVDGNKLNVTTSPSKTKVMIPISKPKKEVPIKFKTSGSLKDSNKAIETINISESVTTIFGSTQKLKNVQNVEVIIPLDQINGDAQLGLPIVLQDGIHNSTVNRVNVSITLGVKQSKTLTNLPIVLQDIPTGYKIELLDDKVDVYVEGTENNLSQLTSEKIIIYPKFDEIKEGEIDVPLFVELPATMSGRLSKTTTKVKISKQ